MRGFSHETRKRWADDAGCILTWERSWKVWSLCAKDALSIEASGGCYMSSGELTQMPKAAFLRRCELATIGSKSA